MESLSLGCHGNDLKELEEWARMAALLWFLRQQPIKGQTPTDPTCLLQSLGERYTQNTVLALYESIRQWQKCTEWQEVLYQIQNNECIIIYFLHRALWKDRQEWRRNCCVQDVESRPNEQCSRLLLGQHISHKNENIKHSVDLCVHVFFFFWWYVDYV